MWYIDMKIISDIACEYNLDVVCVGALKKYVSELLKWNRSINLIGKSTEEDIWTRHIADCLQLLRYIDMNDVICDFGSGAGLPGIVLSIAGVKHMILMESDSRKCSFLQNVSSISGNKVDIINSRIESLNMDVDVVVARAFANLHDILQYGQCVRPKKHFLLFKGEKYNEEINDVKNTHFNDMYSIIVHPSSVNIGSVILQVGMRSAY